MEQNKPTCVMGKGSVVYEMDLQESSHGNGLVLMTLRAFIQRYGEELEDYYDEDFGTDTVADDTDFGSSMVMCMVDNGEEDHLPEGIKKKIRKAGKFRRDKLKHQWSYQNPLNRIHGYVNLVDVPLKGDKKVISISTICSSYFSQKKGVGSDLMKMSEEFARKTGYTDMILEVANEYAGYAEDSEEEEESEEEESEEESDEESEEESEDDEWWFPDENVMDILSDEFWKKCMRKNKDGEVSYNLDKEYIEGCLHSYLFCDEYEPDEDEEIKEVEDEDEDEDEDEPGENEYGGFWYQKGKNSQKGLQNFYEKFGFVEDPSVHREWGVFSDIPYPSMRLEL